MYAVMQGAVDKVNRIIQENLTAIRVVKAYVRGDHEIEKFESVNQNLKNNSERAFRTAVPEYACHAVCHVRNDSRDPSGSEENMAMAGEMEIGELTGFLSYVLQVLNSLMMLSKRFPDADEGAGFLAKDPGSVG